MNLFVKIGLGLATGVITIVAAATPVQSAGIGLSPVGTNVELSAGSPTSGSFTVYNTGDETTEYRITITPYSISDDGMDSDWSSETPRTEMTRWLELSETSFSIPAGERRDVTYTINTPPSAPGGSQHAGIFVQTVPSAVEGGVGWNEARGIRFKLLGSIRNGESREAGSLREQSFPYWLGSGALTARSHVDNTGNLDFNLTQSLKVKNLMGNIVWESEPENTTILAESNQALSHIWPETSFGIYVVNYTVSFLGEDYTVEHIVFLFPVWVIVTIIALLTIIIVTIVHAIMKRHKQTEIKKYA